MNATQVTLTTAGISGAVGLALGVLVDQTTPPDTAAKQPIEFVNIRHYTGAAKVGAVLIAMGALNSTVTGIVSQFGSAPMGVGAFSPGAGLAAMGAGLALGAGISHLISD